MSTATLIARHRVEDFDAWKSVYDEVDGLRKQNGCTEAHVLTDPQDRHEVYVIHSFPSVEQAQSFAGSNDLRDAMGRAGVTGAPRIEIAVEA